MCGIVGLFLKDPDLRPRLGAWFAEMLAGMAERGPDSAGLAVYRDPAAPGAVKLTLFAEAPEYDWAGLARAGAAALDAAPALARHGNHAVLRIAAPAERVRHWLAETAPELRVMGHGRHIEIFKDTGRPAEVIRRFGVARMGGSHAVGHTRMATESAVTTAHSHPFSAGGDVCLVHNGSLSNHNRLRSRLMRRGLAFETDNDTEVAARYLAFRLDEGASLKDALLSGLAAFDGFFTFAVGTADGFAVLRDGFACKPAVLAETEGWVAMASEYRSIAVLPGAAAARIWEPEPSVVYAWSLEAAA